MTAPNSSGRRPNPRKPRRDGWTPERQLRFLEALVDRRSVANAAATAGMSRESAYRLRRRSGAELFATLWDRALQPAGGQPEVHTGSLRDGQLARLLGRYFRDKSAIAGSDHGSPADEHWSNRAGT